MEVMTVDRIVGKISDQLTISATDKQHLQEVARQLVDRYMDELGKDEHPFPVAVALSSIYIACATSDMSEAQAQVVRLPGYDFIGFRSIFRDMARRLQIKTENDGGE